MDAYVECALTDGRVRLQKLTPDSYTRACTRACACAPIWGARKRGSAEPYCGRAAAAKGVVVWSTGRTITAFCIDDDRTIHVGISFHLQRSAVPNHYEADKKTGAGHHEVLSINNQNTDFGVVPAHAADTGVSALQLGLGVVIGEIRFWENGFPSGGG